MGKEMKTYVYFLYLPNIRVRVLVKWVNIGPNCPFKQHGILRDNTELTPKVMET